jgi:cellulose synthase/poly-beta-1,6-N-acetylglucosamine synthase-like glycosyltransferase
MMYKKVAVFIPVHEIPKRAAEIASTLSAEGYDEGQVLLVVDGETTTEISEALDPIRGLPGVTVVDGRPHLGKAEAINRAVREQGSEFLLFLDNDIELPSGTPFLELTAGILEQNDIAELPKAGRGRGPVAAMETYEFLSNVVATEYLAARTGRVPSLNGAAFACRRSLFDRLGGFRTVVNEDTDFAARAFLASARFGFDPAMTVGNEVPETPAAWLKQRRRWSLNMALWSMTYMDGIMRHDPELRPALSVSGLLFPLPLLALLAGALLPLIPADIYHLRGAAAAAASFLGLILLFGPVAMFYARKSRQYGSHFGLPSFTAYALIYLPIWGLASALGVLGIASGKLPELDWKHDPSKSMAAIERKKALRAARKSLKRRSLRVGAD